MSRVYSPYWYEEKAAQQRQGVQIFSYTLWPRIYNTLQAVPGLLCYNVLGHLLDVHARTDVYAAYNGTIQEYTENLVI